MIKSTLNKYSWTRFIQKGLWGFKDINSGEVMIPAQYDLLDPYMGSDLAAAYKDGNWGFINRKNEVVVPFRYLEVSFFCEGFASVRVGNHWGLINEKGVEIIPPEYDAVSFMNSDNRVIVSKQNKYGVVESSGRIFLPCEYDSIQYGRGDGYYEVTRNGKKEYISKTGEIIKIPTYDKKGFSIGSSYYCVCKNGLWGVAYDCGIEVIPCVYSRPLGWIGLGTEEHDELIPACMNDKWGFIDLSGAIRIPFKYDEAKQGSSGFFPVKINGQWGVLNYNGDLVIQPIFDSVSTFGSGFCVVQKDSKKGLIDEKGRLIIPIEYDSIDVSSLELGALGGVRGGSCAKVTVDKKAGLLARDGRLLIPFDFDDLKQIKGGIAPVKKNNKWGFYDVIQGLIIPCIYDEVWTNFINDYAVVYNNDKSSTLLINKNGKTIIEGDYINILSENRFLIKRKGRFGIVDHLNTLITPFEFEDTSVRWSTGAQTGLHNGACFVKKNNNWAVLSKSGTLLTEACFSKTDYPSGLDRIVNAPIFLDGIAHVKKGVMEGFVDTYGQFAVDPIWKKLIYEPSLRQRTTQRKPNSRLYTVHFTDWNGIKKYYQTYANSKQEAEKNWWNSGVKFGANIDYID